jgi:hypothetical protein
MTLTELITEVYTLTNRPDLVTQTLAAVRSATLKAHHSDYYYKDLYETGISFTTAEYLQQFDVRGLLPRWRALKYLRKYDVSSSSPNTGVAGALFEIITPEMVVDTYKVNRENVCYMAGDILQIRSNTKIAHALLGCYLTPSIGTTAETFISWIAISQPWAIIYEAAGAVFRMIGKNDEWGAFRELAGQEYAELKINNIVANGY